MKNILLITLSLIAFNVFSQEVRTEAETIEDIFGIEKFDVVKQIVDLNDENSMSFLKLYNEYDGKRKVISITEYELLNEYVMKSAEMTETQLGDFMTRILKMSADRESLMREYYNKVNEELGASVATQFYQAERYLWVKILNNNYENYSFLGEGEKKK